MSGGASADFLLSGGAAIARIVWLLCDHCGRNKTLETPPRVGSLAIEEKLPLLAELGPFCSAWSDSHSHPLRSFC